MELDDEDYEALGYGAQKSYEVLAKRITISHIKRNKSKAEWFRKEYATNPEFRAKHKANVKKWQQDNKAKVNAANRLKSKTIQGKQTRKEISKRYYDKNKTKISERRKQQRATTTTKT